MPEIVHQEESRQQRENEREDRTQDAPRPARLEHVKRTPGPDGGWNGSVHGRDLKRQTDPVDVVRDGTQAGREPVFVEAVPEPCACVRDPSASLDRAHLAYRCEGLHERKGVSERDQRDANKKPGRIARQKTACCPSCACRMSYTRRGRTRYFFYLGVQHRMVVMESRGNGAAGWLPRWIEGHEDWSVCARR